MIIQKLSAILLLVILLLFACHKNKEPNTWGEKLGFPKDKRVIILHADDMGMCPEANEAGEKYLSEDKIQSASIMMPCQASDQFIEWYKNNPQKDIGLHLTLNSEWKKYR